MAAIDRFKKISWEFFSKNKGEQKKEQELRAGESVYDRNIAEAYRQKNQKKRRAGKAFIPHNQKFGSSGWRFYVLDDSSQIGRPQKKH